MTNPVSLKELINEDVKTAMRARESERLGVIRMITAAIKQKEVDERIEPTDADILTIIEKMIKQRKEASVQFEAGGRPDLVEKEKKEITILQTYMPVSLTEAEIAAHVQQAITQVNAKGAQDMGKVMGILKTQLAGRADMTMVSGVVKNTLSNTQ